METMTIIGALLSIDEKSLALREKIDEKKAQYAKVLKTAERHGYRPVSRGSDVEEMSLGDEVSLLLEQVMMISRMVEDHNHGPEDDRKTVKIAQKLMADVKEIHKSESALRVRAKNLPQLREEVVTNFQVMHRALGQMQLAAPQSVVDLGQSLYFGIFEWQEGKVVREEVDSRYHVYVLAAKADLDHPQTTKFLGFFRHPRNKKRRVIMRPSI